MQVTPFSPYPPADSELPVVKQEMFDVDERFSSNLDVWWDGGGIVAVMIGSRRRLPIIIIAVRKYA